MKFKFNYSQLSAEFLIVVVGVAVALAADGWRQGLAERASEAEYIERLSLDLEQGRTRMERTRENLAEANNGARGLLLQLESNTVAENEDQAINNFAYAAKTGGFSDSFRHDFTYRELVATGRLQLIEGVDIRSTLARYFSGVDSLARERDRLTPKVFDRFRELTGSSPTIFINHGETMTSAERDRLLSELNNEPLLEREVRYLISRLEILDLTLKGRVEFNLELSDMLQNYNN